MLNPRDCIPALFAAAFIVAYSLAAFALIAVISAVVLVAWLFCLPLRMVRGERVAAPRGGRG